MSKETVIVFKDRQSREIQTYVNAEGHGARVSLADFLKLLSEQYGSPAMTLTRSGHLVGLIESADRVILAMKSKTAAVASQIPGGP